MVTMPSARLLRRLGRADVHARRIVAVLAADRHERALHVRDTRRTPCRARAATARRAASHWRGGTPPCTSGSRRSGAGRRPSPSGSCAGLPARRCGAAAGAVPQTHRTRRTIAAPRTTLRAERSCGSRHLDAHDVGARAGGVGQVHRHRRRASSCSARRSPWRTASPSDRTGRSSAACRGGCPGAARRGRGRCAAASRSRPGRRRRCRAFRRLRVHDHAAMAGDVVGDLLDQLHADVAAPRVLHAARGQQPERIVLRQRRRPCRARPPRARRNPSTPAAPGTPASCLSHQCMSCSCSRRPSSAPTRSSRSWYGSSKRRPCAASVGNRYQSVRGNGRVARPCSFHQSRSCTSAAVGELGARRAADGVPDLLARVRPPGVEREVPVRALERHAGGAAVDRRVVLAQEPGAPRELGRDVGEVARLAARSRPRAGAARSPRAPRTARRTSSRRCGSAAGFRGRSPRAAARRRNGSSRRACRRRRRRTGKRAIFSPTAAVSQNEIAGLVR